METILALIAGGFFNRYRGGLFKNRDAVVARINPVWLRRAVKFLVQGDTVNALAFGLFCVIAHASSYQGMLDGSPVYVFLPGAFALFAVQAAMMLRGSTPAWGEYIGAAGGWRSAPFDAEVAYISKLIKPLENKPHLWGVAGLSLRCGEWGLFIGAPLVGFIGLQAFLPVLAGLAAGPLVYVMGRIVPHKYVWPVFEILLGSLLWVSCI